MLLELMLMLAGSIIIGAGIPIAVLFIIIMVLGRP